MRRRRFASDRSPSGSTGCHRPPGGHDIPCGVDVSIESQPAVLAAENALPQRHRLDDISAPRARLARWQPTIYDNQRSAIPLRLVGQHRAKFSPTCVLNRPSKSMVTNKASDIEILDYDRLVLTNEPSGHFVQHVSPPIDDPRVYAGDAFPCLFSVSGALNPPTQGPLSPGQSITVAQLESRVDYVTLLVGQASRWLIQRQQIRYTDVNPNFPTAVREMFDEDLDQNRTKPPSHSVTRDSHGRRFTTVRQRTGPTDSQRARHLSQCQLTVPPAKGRSSVLGGRARALLGLELRVLRSLGKEADVSVLQMPQCLLQRHTRHVIEVSKFGRALPFSKQRRGLGIGHPALLLPSARTSLQRLVVNQTRAAERPQELSRLTFGGIEAIAKGPLYERPRHDPQLNTAIGRCRTHVRVIVRVAGGMEDQ